MRLEIREIAWLERRRKKSLFFVVAKNKNSANYGDDKIAEISCILNWLCQNDKKWFMWEVKMNALNSLNLLAIEFGRQTKN